MLTNCLTDIANLLDVNIDEMDQGQPLFTDPRYTARPFDKDNFNRFEALAPGDGTRRIAYIDGGNLEILRAPNFSVQLVRVAYNIFEGNHRVVPKKVPTRISFFVTALARFLDGKIYYSGILVPAGDDQDEYLPTGEHLTIDSMDKSIKQGTMRADIGVVGSVTRRFTEWLIASRVIKEELREGDLLVRDGTLQTGVANERYYAKKAYEAAKENRVLLGGIAKTSTLFTTTGLSLLAAVHRLSKDHDMDGTSWFYHPIAKNEHPDHPAEIYVAKLHPDTKYVFRCELFKPQVERMGRAEVKDVFADLARISCDPSFLGYPYGLIAADREARVPYAEGNSIKGMVNSTLSGMNCYDKILRHLQATNAHAVLDSI